MRNIPFETRNLVIIAVSLIVVSLIFPFALGLVASAENWLVSTEDFDGDYLGSYSFINEEEGTSGTNIDFIDSINAQSINTIAQIEDSLDSHNKVLEIIDNNNSGYIDLENSFPGRLFGTLEFWIRFTNQTIDGFQIKLYNAILWVFGGKWYRQTDGPPGYTLIPNVNDPIINTWTHIKIDWRSQGGPAYKGMSMNRARYTIDGISSGDVSTDQVQGSVTELRIFTTNAYVGTLWFDAIGYVWNNDYSEGDNTITSITTYLSDVIDPQIMTLFIGLIPLIAVITLLMIYLPKIKRK